jgi:hypothetical protein
VFTQKAPFQNSCYQLNINHKQTNMKKITKWSTLLFVLISVMSSCKKGESAEESAFDSKIAADSTSSSAAVEKKGSDRKFIRTADIKFRVKNVAQSTYAIENATNKFGGFVTYTNLQSTISEKFETKVSQDSTLETIRFTVENAITIRVPNTRLDTVIKTIAKQINFLDYRIIKADDVSLQIVANQMSQNRNATHTKRLVKAIDTKGKKLNEINTAETNLDDKVAENDANKLEKLSIQDQINFSTLTLQLYQQESVKQEMVVNEKDPNAYRPNLGIQIWDSLKIGWYIMVDIITFISKLWGIILIVFVSFFVYKKYFKKQKE